MMRVMVSRVIPAVAALAAVGLSAWWLAQGPKEAAAVRTCLMPNPEDLNSSAVEIAGQVIAGPGRPADNLPGRWAGFRGHDRDNIAQAAGKLARRWPTGGPVELWRVQVGEGHAGAAVADGRVYLMDYDREKQSNALRCLSLADGREIWRYTYPIQIKRNHGMSRTVAAVGGGSVVAMGPKCHVICCDAATGELKWKMDLVRQFGATVPPWYAGQCPLIDGNRVILAPGGKALMIAVDLATGDIVWQTDNPMRWKMTHSSIMPITLGERRMYVYVASGGVAGVEASSGALAWRFDKWRVKIAAVPSPVVLPDGRIFLSGGYNAGSMMIRLVERDGKVGVEELFGLKAEEFGATQQTPIYYRDHLFGIRPGRGDKGELVCLDTTGKLTWTAGMRAPFGLGPLVIGDGLLYALADRGELRLYEADPSACKPLAKAQVLDGHDAWGPMAIAAGRLLLRDLTTLVCLDISAAH